MSSLVSNLNSFVSALFGSGGLVPTFFAWVTSADVLPYFVLGICVSLVLLAIKIVRGTVWGV